jgi:methionine-S-sulfoxide reductase
MNSTTEHAIFAGGCFWCTEAEFRAVDGVISVTSGYTGGHLENPSYEQVSSKQTGHLEAVDILYDPAKVQYETLLDIYWHSIDPTDPGGQFYDRGEPYHTAIFYTSEEQRQLAEQSKEQVRNRLGKDIYTQILPASNFYPAEEYHQRYAERNPIHYNAYKRGSGRMRRLDEIWYVNNAAEE